MKAVHKYMDEYSKELFDTPIEALESERESVKKIVETHQKCKSCNMIMCGDIDGEERCSWCGGELGTMCPDDAIEMYREMSSEQRQAIERYL